MVIQTQILDFTPGSGDVVGPEISTDNAIARFSGTTGKIIKNSGLIINDSNDLSGIRDIVNLNRDINFDNSQVHDIDVDAVTTDITGKDLRISAGDAATGVGINRSGG